jgi:hypothetical protein
VTSVHSVGIEDQDQRYGWNRRLPEQNSRQRNAQQHIVGKDAAEREHGLRRAVHAEYPLRNQPSQKEHDQTSTEEGDQQPRIDRRQLGQIAHQTEQHRRNADREDESGERIGDRLGPVSPARQRVADQDEREQRRGETRQIEQGVDHAFATGERCSGCNQRFLAWHGTVAELPRTGAEATLKLNGAPRGSQQRGTSDRVRADQCEKLFSRRG